jgi:hypothetical protein
MLDHARSLAARVQERKTFPNTSVRTKPLRKTREGAEVSRSVSAIYSAPFRYGQTEELRVFEELRPREELQRWEFISRQLEYERSSRPAALPDGVRKRLPVVHGREGCQAEGQGGSVGAVRAHYAPPPKGGTEQKTRHRRLSHAMPLRWRLSEVPAARFVDDSRPAYLCAGISPDGVRIWGRCLRRGCGTRTRRGMGTGLGRGSSGTRRSGVHGVTTPSTTNNRRWR